MLRNGKSGPSNRDETTAWRPCIRSDVVGQNRRRALNGYWKEKLSSNGSDGAKSPLTSSTPFLRLSPEDPETLHRKGVALAQLGRREDPVLM